MIPRDVSLVIESILRADLARRTNEVTQSEVHRAIAELRENTAGPEPAAPRALRLERRGLLVAIGWDDDSGSMRVLVPGRRALAVDTLFALAAARHAASHLAVPVASLGLPHNPSGEALRGRMMGLANWLHREGCIAMANEIAGIDVTRDPGASVLWPTVHPIVLEGAKS